MINNHYPVTTMKNQLSHSPEQRARMSYY